MKEIMQGMIVAFAMYSAIPMPRIEWNERNMKYCVCFFPLVGAVTGALGILWQALWGLTGTGPFFRAAVFVLIPAAVTGGIHLDGMLDTADALSSHQEKEKKLEILKDSRAGAFAVMTGICYFLLLLAAFTETEAGDIPVIALGYVLSRAYSALALVWFPKAKNSGLLRTFADAAANRRVAAVMAALIAAVSAGMICLHARKGAAGAGLALLVFIGYYRMSMRQFGGITGDLAGWFLQMCELATALGVALL